MNANTTVFIAGSMNIRHLDPMVQERIMNVIAQEYDVVVGDADGVDAAIQRFLLDNGARYAKVYCSGKNPRNNIGDWPVHSITSYHKPGSRAFFTAKDVEMASIADFGLMIWDAKSTGTLSNVIELLARAKNSLVFVDKGKSFHKVVRVEDLEALIEHMSEVARRQADAKIGLMDKIAQLRSRALQFELLNNVELTESVGAHGAISP